MRFDDDAVAVTGAGSGMGRATAIKFAEQGAAVTVVDLDADAADATVARITEAGGDAISVVADVSDADAVEGFVERTVDEFGSLDVLHNNAGIPQRSTRVEDVAESTWDDVVDVNLKSAFLGAKYATPFLRESGGVILNTASTAGIRPRDGLSAYAASKGGMITLTKALAYELAEDGVRVNAICPVATDTDMLEGFTNDGGLTVDAMADTIPLGRLAEPQDVADAATFLASDEAAMITGTALEVDGGRDI